MAITLLSIAMVVAALVIRTAVAEVRRPGSGRKHWRFLTNPRALATGALTGLLLGLLAWATAGAVAAAWAVLAGALVAYVAGTEERDG
ncbi:MULTISPECIES: hypothetical protein [unclassified Streptomyces]|uniref:Uncharacterized protein n=1 Tax=Streptomyces sp. R33 TaxID=3238629 RepID=A0AB39XVN6_9ACTN|nr:MULTISPECIES: hypothetical protein [unclassified Streptomyces]KJY32228.1 hypothetical protein VR46_34605 [Streptomyces sp. NRRL S-444]KOY56455.1 hypothetical protein ADK59_18655 [Streptomyces sp. XY332]TDU73793.1 hypothetical protein EDD91_0405 [Streptomyces sp. KS 21]THA33955.1 hypothetical protein E6W17_30410 [Streptomyces sp. A1547]